ncbi:MAG TPA: MFS transporter [Tepidisphaeraceae bacterium]|nr:MFS transporter [Tepidisphaeraceae bacterium]
MTDQPHDSASPPAPPPHAPALAEADSTPPKGALLIIFMIVFADLMGFGLIIPLLPFYARQYAASDFQVGLLFAVYSGCQLIASPVLGLMSDRFGRRPVLILSQIGSVLGFLLLAFATHATWLAPALGLILVYISRVIDGISGGNISTAQAYISDVTTSENRAKGMGLLGAAFGIGFTIGPAIGGILGHFDPSWPALAAAGFCAVAALLTYLKLPESRTHKPSESEVWLHPAAFRPILRSAPLVQMLLIFFFSMMAFVMMETIFALFLNDTFGFQELQVGAFFALAGIVIVIVQGGLIGRFKRFGEWPLVIAGPLIVTMAMLGFVQIGLRPMVGLLVICTLCNALGRSLQTPALSALISHYSDPKQQGAVFGLFHMLGSLARVIGPIVSAAVYTRTHVGPFIVAACITLAAALWAMVLRRSVADAPVALPADPEPVASV